MKISPVHAALVALSLIFTTGLLHADDDRTTDYNKALAQAKTEKKMVLLDFTGSDWCPACIALEKEVFSQAKFQDYAKKHLILVEVDFPDRKPQSFQLKRQNEDLKDRYDVREFPTVIVLNDDGKKIGELDYESGGPDAFLARLAKLSKS